MNFYRLTEANFLVLELEYCQFDFHNSSRYVPASCPTDRLHSHSKRQQDHIETWWRSQIRQVEPLPSHLIFFKEGVRKAYVNLDSE